MKAGQVREEVDRLSPWFHNLHLPDGTQTRPDHPLGDFPAFKWSQVASQLPDDLTGATALDIGCNAGFYTFELAKRGAKVVAIDIDEHYLAQARWAAQCHGLADRVRFEQRSVYSLAREPHQYDVVLFMGVFYHLRHPLLALDLVARRVRGTMIFQTLTMPEEAVAEPLADASLDDRDRLTEPGWPRMAFIEHRLAGDPTNWWAPNHAGVLAMLRTCGMGVRSTPGHEIYVCTPESDGDELTRSLVEHELAQVLGVRA